MKRYESQDAAQVIIDLWVGLLNRNLSPDQAFSIVKSPQLAQMSTPESAERLAFMLKQMIEWKDAKMAIFSGVGIGESNKATDSIILAGLIIAHANTLTDLDRSQEALLLYDAAENFHAASGSLEFVGECQMDRAIVFRRTGKYHEALKELAKAEAIAKKLGIEEFVAKCQLNQANIFLQLGQYKEAVKRYDEMEPIFKKHRLVADVALTQMNRANALEKMGQYTEAIAEHKKAELLFVGLKDPERVARCQMNRANALGTIGRYQESLTEYDKAEPIFAKLGMLAEVANCQFNRATTLMQLQEYEKAIKEFNQAERVFLAHGLEADVALCQMNRAYLLVSMKRYAEAVTEYKRAKPRLLDYDRQQRFNYGYGVALWHIGQKGEGLKKFTQELEAMRKARRTGGIDETNLEFIAARQQLVHDAVYYALEANQPKKAFDALQDGKAGVLGDLRQQNKQFIPTEDDSFQNARTALCNSLRQSRKEEEIRQKAHYFIKLWRMAQNRQRQNSDLNLNSSEERISLKEIQAALPINWALLDFWVLNSEHVKVFIVKRNGFEVETLEFPYKDIKVQKAFDEIEQWRQQRSLFDLGSSDDALSLFYEKLFAPLMQNHLKGINGLYLVPHSYLHLIPLHACCIKKGHYLCDEFALSYLPSASLLPQLPPLLKLTHSSKMFTLANPERCTPMTLPFSEWEAEQLQQKLSIPKHMSWIGADATIEKIKAWQQIPLMHFSCHGFGDMKFAALSHLRLADDLLLTHDVIYRQPPLVDGALAILNGCQTGVRDWRAVDEGLGLMSAFLLRGASLVLATQWSIGDLCAAEIGVTFLAELVSGGKTPTKALSTAQMRARQITAEEVLARCDELKKLKFPERDFPYEAAKLNIEAEQACLKASDWRGAKNYAILAGRSLRSVGLHNEADQVEAYPDKIKQHGAPSCSNQQAYVYEHPIHWAAFHLVGRVI